MTDTRKPGTRVTMAVLSALAVAAASLSVAAAPASAKPTTPVPVCAGAKDLVVDVTQDVVNEPFLRARDGHVWANFSYTQHLRIWAVGGHQYCVRKDIEGTWVSFAGLSPGLTGTIDAGLTGTFHDTQHWMWTGELKPVAPTTGHLGQVNADCDAAGVCANEDFLIVNNLYFSEGWEHCAVVRGTLEVDGGEHGHISLTIDGGLHKVTASGDITS